MSVSEEIMLKVENVSKVYKLGEIGGTTLRDELQRVHAKIWKKEDPTKKIGAKNYNKGEKFKALDNISFEVKKGERIGIIGHNGAGKSTLLKLISRVTGPTEGNIYLNGRVASMLEVGTGFHPELTGRENIYMNGAILGMTKKEIDAKMEDIIEFSEVRQFIDTPVKRYSSGMYVKLAFSVAAHLDSEIMIMDEVLAVGDMAFQNKCLEKMKSVSEEDNRTILYVSHNMNTIRQLCNRVIVLNCGHILFDGDVETGIRHYMNESFIKQTHIDFIPKMNDLTLVNGVKIKSIDVVNTDFSAENDKKLTFSACIIGYKNIDRVVFRLSVFTAAGNVIATSFSDPFSITNGCEEIKNMSIDISSLMPDDYYLKIMIYEIKNETNIVAHERIEKAICFSILNINNIAFLWKTNYWGNVQLPKPTEK